MECFAFLTKLGLSENSFLCITTKLVKYENNQLTSQSNHFSSAIIKL